MPKREHPFKNVAIPEHEHDLLREIAEAAERSMARQLAVMIREQHQRMFGPTAS